MLAATFLVTNHQDGGLIRREIFEVPSKIPRVAVACWGVWCFFLLGEDDVPGKKI